MRNERAKTTKKNPKLIMFCWFCLFLGFFLLNVCYGMELVAWKINSSVPGLKINLACFC
jgi:hypothetical protein